MPPFKLGATPLRHRLLHVRFLFALFSFPCFGGVHFFTAVERFSPLVFMVAWSFSFCLVAFFRKRSQVYLCARPCVLVCWFVFRLLAQTRREPLSRRCRWLYLRWLLLHYGIAFHVGARGDFSSRFFFPVDLRVHSPSGFFPLSCGDT